MGIWYRTGTAAVTNGSAAVVGTGTAWAAQVKAGDAISFDAGASWQEVGSVTDNTHLTLAANYGGSTASGLSYAVQRNSPLWSLASDLATQVGTLIESLGDLPTAAADFEADNRALKSDGTGKGMQVTGIAIDDSDNVSGIANIVPVDGSNLGDGTHAFGNGYLKAGAVLYWGGGTVTESGDALLFDGFSSGFKFEGPLLPKTAGGHDLGSSALPWGDCYLQAGKKIIFNNGDVTVEHATNLLAFKGATDGYSFSHLLFPETDDGAALGKAGNAWSDGFFATGAVLNFGNGNATLTHSASLFTSSVPIKIGTDLVEKAGTKTFYVPASEMYTRTTNGAAAGTVETTTNRVMLKSFDFDTTTQEFIQFQRRMPPRWNRGTITAKFTWRHAATATNFGVVWALEAQALSDDDAADTAFGTAQSVADVGGTTNDIYNTGATPAITIAGSPAAGDVIIFQVKRVPANSNDTMAIDACLLGVEITYTTDAATD